MSHVWYVTFEVRKRGTLPQRRSPRVTKTFETEREAQEFARAKLEEGLVVFAGTLNPHVPKRIIPSEAIPLWLESSQASSQVNSQANSQANSQVNSQVNSDDPRETEG